jgi:hypothetical protein
VNKETADIQKAQKTALRTGFYRFCSAVLAFPNNGYPPRSWR